MSSGDCLALLTVIEFRQTLSGAYQKIWLSQSSSLNPLSFQSEKICAKSFLVRWPRIQKTERLSNRALTEKYKFHSTHSTPEYPDWKSKISPNKQPVSPLDLFSSSPSGSINKSSQLTRELATIFVCSYYIGRQFQEFVLENNPTSPIVNCAGSDHSLCKRC